MNGPEQDEPDLWNAIGSIILLKMVLVGLVYAAVVLTPGYFNEWVWQANYHYSESDNPEFIDSLRTWDGNHYLHLADQGYDLNHPSAAFYPLWPFLIRAASDVTGLSLTASALLLANGFSLVAAVGFLLLLKDALGLRTAWRATVLWILFPGSLFFCFPYSESLFALIAVAFMASLFSGREGLASALGFLASLTRPLGVFLFLPFLMHRIQVKRARLTDPEKAGKLLESRDLLALGPVLGLGGYFIWMGISTGNPLAGLRAQEFFLSQSSLWRLFDPVGFFSLFAMELQLHGFGTSILDRLCFILFLATIPMIWKMDKRWFAFVLPLGLVPAFSVALMSFTRYSSLLIPVFLALGYCLSRQKRDFWFFPLCILFFGLQLLLMVRHVNNFWAG